MDWVGNDYCRPRTQSSVGESQRVMVDSQNPEPVNQRDEVHTKTSD